MSSRSARSYTPERYSPQFDKHHKGDDPAAGGPKRASTIAVGYDDHPRDRNGRYKSNTSAPRRRNSVSTALAKRDERKSLGKSEESDWDTDYDPRDRLYLSAEEESDSDDDRRHSSRHRRDGDRREPSRWHNDRRSDRHSDWHYDRHHDRPRDRDLDHRSSRRSGHDHGNHHHDSHGHPPSSSSRDKDGHHSSRPRAPRRTSSAGHAHRYPPSSSRSHKSRPQPSRRRSDSVPYRKAAMDVAKDIEWNQVLRTAFKTSTITAMKVAHTQGSLVDKGAKVVSTGLAAALIDTLMTQQGASFKGGVRHAAIRHAAEMALGSMVIGPAVKGMSLGGKK